jgi:hypothetical protein
MGNLLDSDNFDVKISKTSVPAKITIPAPEYDKIFLDMVQAMKGNRIGCETVDSTKEYVKLKLQEACQGMRYKNGKWEIWQRCPAKTEKEVGKFGWRESLKKRLRVYQYDLDRGFLGAHKHEFSNKVDLNPNQLKLSPEQEKKLETIKNQILEEFPTLDTISDSIGLNMLAHLKIKMEELIKENRMPEKKMVDMYKDLTDNMGISGSKRNAIKEQVGEGTLNDLFNIFQKTEKIYPELEEDYLREELELLYQKFKSNNITRETFDALITKLGFNFSSDKELEKFIDAKRQQAIT